MRSFELVLALTILVGSPASTVSGQGFKKVAGHVRETKTEEPSSPMDVAIERNVLNAEAHRVACLVAGAAGAAVGAEALEKGAVFADRAVGVVG